MRVGFLWPAKKQQRQTTQALFRYLRENHPAIELIQLEWGHPMLPENVHIVVHKLSEWIRSSETDALVRDELFGFENWIRMHSIKLIDPLPSVRKLMYRSTMLKLIDEACSQQQPHVIHAAPFKVLLFKSLKDLNADLFPCVIKHAEACSSLQSHDMMLVRSKLDPLNDNVPFKDDTIVVAQKMIFHDEFYYKVYIVGSSIHIQPRQSIRIDSTTFNSQDLPKECLRTTLPSIILQQTNAIKDLASIIRRSTGLSLFGFDVIVQKDTNALYVIDLNYFPSYIGMPDFEEAFVQLLYEKNVQPIPF